MSHKHVVLLDMDGVICNFMEGIIKSLGISISHDEWLEWNYHEKLGISSSEFWCATNAKLRSSLLHFPLIGQLLPLTKDQLASQAQLHGE